MAIYQFINDSKSFTLLKDSVNIIIPKNTFSLLVDSSNPQVLKSYSTFITEGLNNDINLDIDTVIIDGNSVWVDAYELLPILNNIILAFGTIVGTSPDGSNQNVGVNQAGAMLTSDFGTEVSRGLYPTYEISTKFGRASNVDVGNAPYDIWNGGAYYTGHNPFVGENIEVFSSSVDDVGALRSDGTVTTAGNKVLIDGAATFISDGVIIGDLVINDTCGCHGHIVSVDSETQVTVFDMHNGLMTTNEVGDSYRIATSAASGASVIEIMGALDSNFNILHDEYIILNGTTPVIVTGDFRRVNKAKVVLDGGVGVDGHNLGTITIRQETTPINIFAEMPISGQTNIACYTVPVGKSMIIKRLYISITRSSGASGSANVVLNSREVLGSWNGLRSFDIQTGGNVSYTLEGGLTLYEGTDIKLTADSVSDNNTIVNGEFEFYLIDI